MNFFTIAALGYLSVVVECFRSDVNYDDKTMIETNPKLPYLFDNAHYPPPGIIPMLNRKVFRGRRVSIREHPYVASIRRNVAHYLMGTILSMNTILTIAHPLIDVSIGELSVVVGENYADRGAMLHTIIIMIVHEHFNHSSLEHDIALLRIYEDITFKGCAKSIPIHDHSELFYGFKAFVTGWGRCDRTNGMYLGPGMLCQGIARREHEGASCLAVPGAPLVAGGRLAGVLSWGFSCGHSTDLPLIFTSIFWKPCDPSYKLNTQKKIFLKYVVLQRELLIDAIMKVASIQHFRKAYYKSVVYQIGDETSKIREHFRNMLLIHNNTKLNMTRYNTATGTKHENVLLQEWMNYTMTLQHLRADIETTVRMLERLEVYNEKDNKGIHNRMQRLRRSGRKRFDINKMDSLRYMPTVKSTMKSHVKWKPGNI